MQKFILLFIVLLSSCKKEYYLDSGVHNGKFDGTIMQYLESKPIYFDTLVQIIKLANLQDELNNNTITFFAPCDSSIAKSLNALIVEAYEKYNIKVERLNQIKPKVWRRFLSMYIFSGKNKMTDYSQLDLGNIVAFDGKMYASNDGVPMNIGVIYQDVNGLKYLGYRRLVLSYISDLSLRTTVSSWQTAHVSSVDIEPNNGYVHILQISKHNFGFSIKEFVEGAINAGL